MGNWTVGVAALALLLFGCAHGPARRAAPPPIERQCAQAELARQPDAAVRALLGSADGVVRARAALAVGRIRDAQAAATLAAMLGDAEAGDPAAWALGRVAGGEQALVECVQRRCPSAAEAARALGGPGRGPLTLQALAGALEADDRLAAEAGAALGIVARLGGKGADAAVRDAAAARLWTALSRPQLPVRIGAAYALGRMAKAEGALPPALDAALRDPSAELRALAARAAGRQGAPAASLQPLLLDADWRVRVEAARALGTVPGGEQALAAELPSLARAAQKDPRMAHALVALLESLGRAGPAAAAIPDPASLAAAAPAATVAIRCAAAEARDRAARAVAAVRTCGAGLEPEWRSRLRTGALAAELASAEPSPSLAEQAAAALRDPDGRVREAAASAADPALADGVAPLLADPDPVVAGAAATALAKSASVARKALPQALQAVARLHGAHGAGSGDPRSDALVSLVQLVAEGAAADADAARAALAGLLPVSSPPLWRALDEALRALGGADAGKVPAPAVSPESAAGQPGGGPRPQRLRLHTTAGELVVRLRSDDGEAPLTSAAIAALAARGFYDNLLWHRVVPDFVIQGGDPRGDGEGGPGWALPDEHTPLRFRRGTLGIATSGPETGGSQLFLCHAPQPHLDGRYTIAGELESGEDVMDAIQVGDRILSVRVE